MVCMGVYGCQTRLNDPHRGNLKSMDTNGSMFLRDKHIVALASFGEARSESWYFDEWVV